MYLVHSLSGEKHEGIISPVGITEFKQIKESGRFNFNWRKEGVFNVFKLQLKKSKEMIGLMSVIDIPGELRLEIHLLESSKENVGAKKEYLNIAGCLIAFACGLAFQKGYYGFISLVPKTLLRNHYMDEYGFENGGLQLFSDTENSTKLIQKYL